MADISRTGLHAAPSDTTMPAAKHSTGNTRLRGRLLLVVRSVWLSLTVLSLSLFLSGIPATYQRALIISPETRAGLQQLGFGTNFPALYDVIHDCLIMLIFTVVALFLVWRRSDDWLVLLVALTLISTGIIYTVPASEAPVPLILIAIAISAGEICQVAFVYLFPDGRFVPRWLWSLLVPMFIWRPVIWTVNYLPNYLATTRTAENYGSLRQDPLDTALMVGLFVIGIFAQFYRYRYASTPLSRQQTKWLFMGLVGAVLVTSAYVISFNALGILENSGYETLFVRTVGRTFRQLVLLIFPAAITFSILRYRLWDIDIIINRTLVYVPLTAFLAGLFSASVTLFQKFFLALTGQTSDVAIVMSTLMLVTLFTPLKNGLQTFVDKRFKEAPNPTKHLQTFREQIQSRICFVDPPLLMQRLLEEAVVAFNARSGAVYLNQDERLDLLHVVSGWQGESVLSMPLEYDGRQLGLISLGARKHGPEYTSKDRETLQDILDVVAQAIAFDRQTLRTL